MSYAVNVQGVVAFSMRLYTVDGFH